MAGEILEELPQWFHYVGSKPTLVVSKGTVLFKSLPVLPNSWLSKKHYKFFPVLVKMRKMTTRSS